MTETGERQLNGAGKQALKDTDGAGDRKTGICNLRENGHGWGSLMAGDLHRTPV
jgi:hypothetical protein